ncbi:MAG: class I SAM-dependent methyltransferase [Bacteroidales bacterium]|nr:class I SAM-dependent methyltransferase [Bacteroidales bacterium]
MKNPLKSLFTQCALPQGFTGRLMLKFMNHCHAPLTNWGLSFIKFDDKWKMLDIGCGGGATLKRLLKRSPNGMVYGIDISEESVIKAGKVNAKVLDKQVFVQKGTASSLPYPDNTFNLVTAVETVYFWPDLENCFKEVRRVLNHGGLFSIIVEVVKKDSSWTKMVDGMKVYPPEKMKEILENVGFKNIEIHYKKPSFSTIIAVNP